MASQGLNDIRNLLLLLELLVVLLIPSVMTNNIGVANIQQSNSYFFIAQNLVLGFVAITAIMLIIQLIITFVGVNQSSKKNSAYQIVFHFLGCLLFGYYVIAPLHYSCIWYIWVVFVLIPFIGEVTATGIRVTHNAKYDKVIQSE